MDEFVYLGTSGGFSVMYIIYVKISPSKVLYEFKFEIACSTEGSRSAIEGTYDESGRCISGADNPHKVESQDGRAGISWKVYYWS